MGFLMNVRGWGFSCQIPLSLEQRVAVAVKLAPPQPAESRAKMLYPSSPSLLVAHASVLLQHCFCCSYFMRLPDAFFHFFFPDPEHATIPAASEEGGTDV